MSKESKSSSNIVSYSGHKLPVHHRSYSNEVSIEFTSDDEIQGKGFIISISFERKGKYKIQILFCF